VRLSLVTCLRLLLVAGLICAQSVAAFDPEDEDPHAGLTVGSKGPKNQLLYPGYAAYTKGDWVLGASMITEVIESGMLVDRKEMTEALIFRAKAYIQGGKVSPALNDLGEVIKQRPKYAKAYVVRAKLYRSQGDYQKSIDDLSRAISLLPGRQDLYLNRSRSHQLAGDLNAALEDIETAVNIAPDDANVYFARGKIRDNMKQTRQAFKDLTRAIELSPRMDKAYARRAQIRLKRKDVEGALTDIETALRLNPYRSDYHAKQGWIHAEAGRTEMAEADHLRALAIDPRDPVVYFYRGLALKALGDAKASIEQFNKALDLAPGYANAYCMRADLYLNSGHPEEALKDATRGWREGATTGVCSEVLGKIKN
jgi:tetratricopeptide (TPR) repeat protein